MLTYKVQLKFGTDAARAHWVEQMRLVRDCYNFASNIVFEEKVPLKIKAFHNRLYRAERDEFPEIPAQICCKIYKQLLGNYRTIQDQEEKVKRERSKKKEKTGNQNGNLTSTKTDEPFLTKPIQMKNPCVWLDRKLYSNIDQESISLSSGVPKKRQKVKFVRYPKFDEMVAKYEMRNPILLYDERKDVFNLCVLFATPDCEPIPESYLGVDLGLKRIATLSDGTAIVDKGYLARRRRIRHNKSIFRKHKKKSHSARRKLKMLGRKEKNVSKEMCHIVANEILSHEGSVVVMEDLSKIKQTTSKTEEGHNRKRHNNRMSQVPFFLLRQILTYKAPLRGKRVETVPPRYTSQEDCRNGSREGCKRQGCRFYTSDGLVFDADWNAAINICNRKHPTPFSLPLDGRLNFVGRRSQHANRGSGNRPASPQALAVGS